MASALAGLHKAASLSRTSRNRSRLHALCLDDSLTLEEVVVQSVYPYWRSGEPPAGRVCSYTEAEKMKNGAQDLSAAGLIHAEGAGEPPASQLHQISSDSRLAFKERVGPYNSESSGIQMAAVPSIHLSS